MRLEERLEELELEAYADGAGDTQLYQEAVELFENILNSTTYKDEIPGEELDYFNPGEPGIWLKNSQIMALTSIDHFNVAGNDEVLDRMMFDTRMYLAWCRDILDHGWQYDLEVNDE